MSNNFLKLLRASKFRAGKVLIHDFCETVLAFWADKGITTQEQFLPLDNFHFFKLLIIPYSLKRLFQ